MKETKRDGLILKPADSADMELLFRWVNDDRVRENAFHKEKISFEEHQKWFFDLLRDKRQNQYILYQDREPVGQIRLYICGGVAEIDYSIAPEKREQGYGRMLICLFLNKNTVNTRLFKAYQPQKIIFDLSHYAKSRPA